VNQQTKELPAQKNACGSGAPRSGPQKVRGTGNGNRPGQGNATRTGVVEAEKREEAGATRTPTQPGRNEESPSKRKRTLKDHSGPPRKAKKAEGGRELETK